jgi:hypothetical protein
MTTNADTRTRFHPLRVQGRKLAAEVLSKAQAALQDRGDDSVTDRALGMRWAHPKPIAHSAIGALFDAGSGHAMAFGDVLALPKDLAREALMRAFASLDGGNGPGTRDTFDAIQIDLANAIQAYRNDLADGREDDHATHANNLLRIGKLAIRGYLASTRKAGT